MTFLTGAQLVTTPIALIAFALSIVFYCYRLWLGHRRKIIQSVLEADRAELVAKTLRLFDVDTSGLSRSQQYQLAMEQIRAREKRFRLVTLVGFVAALCAVLALIYFNYLTPSPPSASQAALAVQQEASLAVQQKASITAVQSAIDAYDQAMNALLDAYDQYAVHFDPRKDVRPSLSIQEVNDKRSALTQALGAAYFVMPSDYVDALRGFEGELAECDRHSQRIISNLNISSPQDVSVNSRTVREITQCILNKTTPVMQCAALFLRDGKIIAKGSLVSCQSDSRDCKCYR